MNEMGNPDQGADLELIRGELRKFAEAVDTVVEELYTRLDGLEKTVHEELIGGITELYETGQKNQRIEGYKSQYGERLSPIMDAYQALAGDGADLYDNLDNELADSRGQEGVDVNAKTEEAIKALEDKINMLKEKLTGKPAEAPKAEPVAEIEKTVEIKKPEKKVEGKTRGASSLLSY